VNISVFHYNLQEEEEGNLNPSLLGFALSDCRLEICKIVVEVDKFLLDEPNIFKYLLDEGLEITISDTITVPELFFESIVFLVYFLLFPCFPEMRPEYSPHLSF
jgi:hypothetical protein